MIMAKKMNKAFKGLSKYCLFCYLYHYRHGYFSELETLMPENILNEFLTVGFLKTGYNKQGKTWGLTNYGRQFFEDVYDKGS